MALFFWIFACIFNLVLVVTDVRFVLPALIVEVLVALFMNWRTGKQRVGRL